MPRLTLRILALVFLVGAAAGASPLSKDMREVERLRGMTFAHDVAQRSIDRSDLRRVLRQQIDKSLPYPASDYVEVLRAMRLVDGSQVNLIEKMLDLYDAQVLAFYDPMTHTYFAINQLPKALASLGDAEALKQSVVLHELTHALQDQRFGASKRDLQLQKDADAEMAYHALLEGEATLVMLAWLLEKGGQSLDAAIKNDMMMNMMASAAAAEQTIDPSTPRYFVESLKFPYIEGLRLVAEGYKRGGWKEINRMHTNPPRSTREVIHLPEYFARLDRGEMATWTFDAKPPDSQVLSVEHLGEFHWRFLVGDHAAGWVDDRVVIGCDRTVNVETRWENPENAASFRDAYVAFLREQGLAPRVATEGRVVKVTYTSQ